MPLREVMRARHQRRRELRTVIQDRKKTVDALLEIKSGKDTTTVAEEGTTAKEKTAKEKTAKATKASATPALKRYFNE